MFKVSNRTKNIALCGLLMTSIYSCNNSRNNYINTLKECVKENVSQEEFDELEEKASGFFTNKEQVWRDAYDEYCDPYKSYYEAGQNLSK